MKKLLSISPSKIYLVCGLSLILTLGAFWHHQSNQTQLDRLSILNQGVGTCFNRLSQTFTALMIKDIQSPYLNRGFMALSDECLSETIKGINPFKKNVGKGYQTLTQLISEVHWFHESVLKIHNPMMPTLNTSVPLSSVSDRFTKMETFKMDLIDEIDQAINQLRTIQTNDGYMIGGGLILFVLCLTLLSLQEFNRLQLNREIEREALNFLKSGNSNVSAIVDRLVDRALLSQGMPVTAQIFRDYHGNLLEKTVIKASSNYTTETKVEEVEKTSDLDLSQENSAPVLKTSLKEVLTAIQQIQPKDSIHMSEVREVQLNVPYETFEQMINSAVNQLASRRQNNKKIMISNQIHSDKSIVNLFLAGSTFTANELEFTQSMSNAVTDSVDMNLVVLKEMVNESGSQWHLENKVDRHGHITGMNIRFIVNRTPKEKSKLVSLMKGKKKDLTKEMMN